jgi:hypothetical protein
MNIIEFKKRRIRNLRPGQLVIWLSLIILILQACKKDFEGINTNPNLPKDVEPALLLRQVIYNYGEEMSYEGFVAGNLLGQHFTMIDFNLFDRHSLTEPQLGGNPWPVIYTNLRDNNFILESARSNTAYAVYEGPALILKAYIAAALTDIYGDVPYTEALLGIEGTIAPKYDSQESIYSSDGGILNNLEMGIAVLQNYNGPQTLDGDILFNGDLAAWITFAKSLQIKCLMRISNRIDVSSQLQILYDDADFMSSNAQNAVFDFSNGLPNSFRMAQLRDGDFNLYVMSETMEEVLYKYSDPRMSVLFRPFGNDTTGFGYEGLLNGPDASATSISVADYSLPGTIFRTHTGDLDANFLTSWETQFLLAEASEKGIITANAQTLYDNAVTQAFEYWGVDLPATYLTSDSAAFGIFGADKLEQIITQKWIANSINGYEGWIEYRRTGLPKLKNVSASLNGGLIPMKMPYPPDEAALNSENFPGNDVNGGVWWDLN